VDDVPNSSTAATQTIRFSPETEMVDGHRLAVDLDTARGVTTGADQNPSPVDYRSATAGPGTLRGGSVALTTSNDG
jgi:hypothetical protein